MTTTNSKLGFIAMALFATSTAVSAVSHHTFATELQEVRTGSVNGKEYLTLHINSDVGPSTCHGSVLKIDTASFTQEGRQQAIETIALSAMLTSDSVMITVPLDWDDCLDGMPMFTDLYLLPQSP